VIGARFGLTINDMDQTLKVYRICSAFSPVLTRHLAMKRRALI
jgi:hypothetical protein